MKLKETEFCIEFEDSDAIYSKPVEQQQSSDINVEQDHGNKASDDDRDENDDKLRLMPRAEDRAKRAKAKQLKSSKEEDEEEDERARADAEASYFESVIDTNTTSSHSQSNSNQNQLLSFSQLNLSRSLLRAVERSGYVTPTPVQAKVIPLALAGRDVCASAVTGSGKTAAFLLPILERLLFRSRDVAMIHVLVVTPTRELATQIHEVLVKLAQFTDITSLLVCGGKKDVKSQEAMLRQCPDIVIATPGRIIDHLRNSQGVSIDNLDVLVLDEVDRLLELGFQEELEELVKYCPENRQTLLFSATMTPKVEDLAKLSLKRPVRVKTSAMTLSIAPRLVQEFVKVKQSTPEDRESILAALIARSFPKRTIVFFETKKDTHHFFIVLKLLGIRVAELHGDMTQTLRYLALESFKSEQADVLVCTDVAARGLDISGVQAVLNADMPRNSSTYVHRVGRTARAGCSGRAVTLVCDSRRKIMKEVLKGEAHVLSGDAQGQILSRTIPSDIIAHFKTKIATLDTQILQYVQNEKYEHAIQEIEAEALKASNLLLHADEINSRPARTWYQSNYTKEQIQSQGRLKVQEEEMEAEIGKDEMKKIRIEKQRKIEEEDYRLDEQDAKKLSHHRMSRVKRRRLEVIKAMNDEGRQSRAEQDNDDERKVLSVKSIAKRSKASKRDQKQLQQDKTIEDITARNSKKNAIVTATGKTKVVRQKFAAGGLDHYDMDWNQSGGGRKKDRLKREREIETFQGHDTSVKKFKKHAKVSNNAFKSKKKFKRR